MNVGFIGVGKIASAVIEGLCTSAIENTTIHLSPRSERNSKQLADRYSQVRRLDSNQDVLDQSDIIFIALRPGDALEILRALHFSERHIIISLIPLIKYADIAEAVKPATSLSRAIPLPPVRYHRCPIPILHGNDTVNQIFNHIGQPLAIPTEEQLHVIWTLSGFIAPFYDLLNELSLWATAHGARKEIANQYIASMFQSLSSLAEKADPIDFEELARHAATAKGMNEQASKEIREKGVLEAYRIATDNIYKRFGS